MKKLINLKVICLFMLPMLISCSKEATPVIQEEFISAQINETAFDINETNGLLSAQKQLTSYGTINLLVSGKTHEGKAIEFLILHYYGEKSYAKGNRPFVAPGGFINNNWCKYSEDNSQKLWSSTKEVFSTGGLPNYVEITEDDGSYITGHFSFEGYNSSEKSARSISEGNFKLKIKALNF